MGTDDFVQRGAGFYRNRPRAKLHEPPMSGVVVRLAVTLARPFNLKLGRRVGSVSGIFRGVAGGETLGDRCWRRGVVARSLALDRLAARRGGRDRPLE